MYKNHIKRIFDLFFSIILFIIFLLPMFLVWVIIRISSPGKAIFKQVRIGKNEEGFYIYKFRTMKHQLSQNEFRLSDRERVTTIGKILRRLSVDELPQLVNIIKGDMSFIGPRPFIRKDFKDFTNEETSERLKVLPGMTGLAQVNGRNDLCFREKLEYDLAYVEKISFRTDLRVLIKTFGVVIRRNGIDRENVRKQMDVRIEDKKQIGI